MSKHLGDFDAGITIHLKFTTYRPSTGAAYTLAGVPVVSVYKDGSTTESTAGVTLTADFDSRTGLNHVAIDLSADGTFYAAGSFYEVVITTGTVDSISVVGAVVASFTLHKSSGLKPATAGRALVVDAAGLADANAVKLGPTGSGTAQTARDVGASVLLSTGTGTGQLDFTAGVVKSNLVQILATALTETSGLIAGGFKKFFNVAAPTGTVNSLPDAVPGAAGALPTTNGTKVNQTVDLTAGQSIAVSDKSGFSLTTGEHTNIAGDVETGLTAQGYTTTRAGYMDVLNGLVAAIWNALTSGMTTVGSIGKLLATYITGDAFTRLGVPVGASLSADVAALKTDLDGGVKLSVGTGAGQVNASGGKVPATLASTDVTGNVPSQVKGQDNIDFGALQKASLNAATPASVTGAVGSVSSAVALISAYDPAKTAAQAGDAMALTSGERTTLAGVIWAMLTSGLTAVGSIGKLLADNITGSISAVAAAVWDVAVASHLTAGTTGAALNASGSAGDPWATSLPGAYGTGTAGKIVGDNLDAKISTRTKPADSQVTAAVVLATSQPNYAPAKAGDVMGKSPATLASTDVSGNLPANVKAWNGGALPTVGDATAGGQALLASGIAAVQSDTDDIQTRIPAALVGGRMDASVGAYQAGQIPAKVADLPSVPTTDQIVLAMLQRKITHDALTGEFVIWNAAGDTEVGRLTPTTDAAALPIIGMRPTA